MRGSIRRRLLGSSTLAAAAFLGLTGIALDQAYRDSVREAFKEQLQAHVHVLLAAADEDPLGRPRLPETLAAPRFNQPDSGLYATVMGVDDRYQWRSASLLGRELPVRTVIQPGQSRLIETEQLFIMQQGFGWEDLAGNSLPYVFVVAMEAKPLLLQQATFRHTLWAWLGGLALVLLLLQFGLIRWGLQPLQSIADQLRRVEQGETDRLDDAVPLELAPLTQNLNSLITHAQARQERLRHALADLAHSLKTPLAILRGVAHQQYDPKITDSIQEQVMRIDQIVSYQRQRMAVAGRTVMLTPIPLKPIITRLCNGLSKVHAERHLRCEIQLPDHAQWHAEQGDLFELFGNLLENAFKYTETRVRVRWQDHSVLIEDDGPGIAPSQIARVLQRGERADQQRPGEGIGLAVVQEVVRQYRGQLQISQSDWQGALVQVTLQNSSTAAV